MFTSDNQTLRSISWLIRNRFIAVTCSSVYCILSPLLSVGSIKINLVGICTDNRVLDFILLLYYSVVLIVCVYVNRCSVSVTLVV